jgi:hypothetical protein
MNSTSRKLRKTSWRRAGAAVAASGAIAVTAALTLAGPAGASTTSASTSGYSFRTVNNSHDVTFNQLLGVNNRGVIAGYFGSGAQGHPNKGYELLPWGQYVNENFPGSASPSASGPR